MANHRFNLQALNAIVVALGGDGGHSSNIAALNEWAVLAGGSGNHSLSIDALNEIIDGSYRFNLDALSAIAGDLSATGAPYSTNIEALNQIIEVIGGGGWWDETALVDIDFVNNRAWAATDGEVAIDTLFDFNFDPSFITENGYFATDQILVLEGAAGELFAETIDGFTLVVHGEFNALDNIVTLNSIPGIPGNGNFGIYTNDPDGISAYSQGSAAIDGDSPWTDGSEGKIAFTVTPTKMSLSDRGDATDTVALTTEWVAGGFYYRMPQNMLIYSIVVYSPKADVDLPALSSVLP